MQESQDTIVGVVTRIFQILCCSRGRTFSVSKTSRFGLETTSLISNGYWRGGGQSGWGMSLTLTAI